MSKKPQAPKAGAGTPPREKAEVITPVGGKAQGAKKPDDSKPSLSPEDLSRVAFSHPLMREKEVGLNPLVERKIRNYLWGFLSAALALIGVTSVLGVVAVMSSLLSVVSDGLIERYSNEDFATKINENMDFKDAVDLAEGRIGNAAVRVEGDAARLGELLEEAKSAADQAETKRDEVIEIVADARESRTLVDSLLEATRVDLDSTRARIDAFSVELEAKQATLEELEDSAGGDEIIERAGQLALVFKTNPEMAAALDALNQASADLAAAEIDRDQLQLLAQAAADDYFSAQEEKIDEMIAQADQFLETERLEVSAEQAERVAALDLEFRQQISALEARLAQHENRHWHSLTQVMTDENSYGGWITNTFAVPIEVAAAVRGTSGCRLRLYVRSAPDSAQGGGEAASVVVSDTNIGSGDNSGIVDNCFGYITVSPGQQFMIRPERALTEVLVETLDESTGKHSLTSLEILLPMQALREFGRFTSDRNLFSLN